MCRVGPRRLGAIENGGFSVPWSIVHFGAPLEFEAALKSILDRVLGFQGSSTQVETRCVSRVECAHDGLQTSRRAESERSTEWNRCIQKCAQDLLTCAEQREWSRQLSPTLLSTSPSSASSASWDASPFGDLVRKAFNDADDGSRVTGEEDSDTSTEWDRCLQKCARDLLTCAERRAESSSRTSPATSVASFCTSPRSTLPSGELWVLTESDA